MPHVHYSGIDMTPISNLGLVFETVTDPSQMDFLYDAVHVSGTFIVNGQSELRSLDFPPVSLKSNGSVLERKQEDINLRPPGVPVVAAAANNDGPERQRGAVRDNAALFAQPYKANFASPTYAADNQKVSGITVEPSPNSVSYGLLVERLKLPRGQLVVYEGTGQPNEIVLHSPGFNFHCDAKGGPIPQLLDLTYAQGDGMTYFVSWSCVTYVNKRRRADTNDPLLSNRWTMTHHVRNGGFTDVEVEGTALFDLGIIHKLGLNADTWRPNLFLPIPFGYERKDLIIQEGEDGATIRYKFLDEQKEIHFPASVTVDAVDIETEHRQYVVGNDDVLTGALSVIDSTLNRKWLTKAATEGKRDEMKPSILSGAKNPFYMPPPDPFPPPAAPPAPKP